MSINIEKFRQELISDHPDAKIDEEKVLAIAEHMRERISIKNEARARAIATLCFYETINKVALMWEFNMACSLNDWEGAARLLEATHFALIEAKAAKRAAAMLRNGR